MKINFILFFITLFGQISLAESVDQKVESASSQAFQNADFLGEVDRPNEKANFQFDFGSKDLLSVTLYRETVSPPGKLNVPDNEEVNPSLEGIKKVFKVKNHTNRVIRITDYETDCSCISLGRWDGEDLLFFPYDVKPRETVEIVAVFNPYMVAPGIAHAKATIVGGKSGSVLATFQISGKLTNGIVMSPNRIILSNTKRHKSFRLKIKKNIQRKIGSRYLKLVSSNPYVTVTSQPKELTVMGIVVKRNLIILPDPFGEDLPRDIDLTFGVELSNQAPLGKMFSKIELTAPELPALMLIQNTHLWVEAEKKGTMNLKDSNVVMFEDAKYGTSSVNRVQLNYLSRLLSKNLKAFSSSKYFEVKIVFPVKDKPKSPSSQKGLSGAIIEISTSPQTPRGSHHAKVTIQNVENNERIEIRALATIR
jgi:hypothetical protein